MRLRQSPSAQVGVVHHDTRREQLHQHLNLHVVELANIELPAGWPDGPTQEKVTGRLHHPVPVHNPLAMIWVNAFTGIRLQDRSPRFLDLKEKRIVGTGQQERNPAPRSDAANANNFHGEVAQLIMVQ